MTFSDRYPMSVFRELQEVSYSKRNRRSLFEATKGSEDFVQRLKILKKLPIHNGCVNCICWNETGSKILSGSDDQHLIITDPFTYKVVAQYRTNHRANIFSAKFLPNTNDNGIVSCCGDGSIFYTDLSRIEDTQDCLFNCHAGTTYDVVTIPNDPNVFLSCGEDYTVRSFDLRVKNKCSKAKCKEDVIIQCRRAVTALTVNAMMPCQIAIGCADSTARLYDRRMVGGIHCRLSPVDAFIRPGLEKKPYRITSLNFSPEGEDLLVSYSSEHVYLFGLRNSKDMMFSPDAVCMSDEEEGNIGVWCSNEKGDSVPVRRLRLRGDWSDTGPDARPHSNAPATAAQGGRRLVQGGLIQRMTDVLSRMLNDPATRAALSQGGESEPSEQMQIEEGLGEYLGIDQRLNEPVAEPNPLAPVSSHNRIMSSEFAAEPSDAVQNCEAGTEQFEPMEASSSGATEGPAGNSSSQPNPNPEVPVASSSSMETDVMPEPEPTCSYSAPSTSGVTESSKPSESTPSTSNVFSEDEEDIAPVKRAKDDRKSPFDDDDEDNSDNKITIKVLRKRTKSVSPQIKRKDKIKELPLEQGSSSSSGMPRTRLQSKIAGGLSDVSQDDELTQSLIDESPDPLSNLPDVPTHEPEPEALLPSGEAPHSSFATLDYAPNLPSPPTSDLNSPGEPSTNPDMPSTSRYNDERVYESPSTSNLTDLTDELSTMFNGFKEKYGKKPMVNLVYSVRGSTASTISMTVDDPNNRGQTSNDPMQQRRESGSMGEVRAQVSTTLVPRKGKSPPKRKDKKDDKKDKKEDKDDKKVKKDDRKGKKDDKDDAEEEEDEDEDKTDKKREDKKDKAKGKKKDEAEPGPSTSTADAPAYSTRSASSTRMERELSKAIRSVREVTQDETIRLKKANIRMKYTGHRNARTMIKEATFWGRDYVMSGSDCGHVFIWTRETGRLVMTLQADNHVVNCLQPHPTLPILATSGIDYDLKLWAPTAPEPEFDLAAAQELMNRNAIMLEETKDTITVPASFMIRMLACLNQLRRGGPRALRRRRFND